MSIEEIKSLFEAQGKKRWAVANTTAKERIVKLQKLRKAIVERQQEFYDAVWADFHKSKMEAWLSEIFPTLEEIDYAINNLPEWMEDKSASWTFYFPTNKCRSHFEPMGRVLIMSPWNYPLLLSISPIVAAIAAGNVVIAKPSNKTPHVSAFLKSLFENLFEEDEVAVILGTGVTLGEELLSSPFDHMFFTGSPKIGAHVAECAAKVHAGVTLELGGKSPAIILDKVNIKDAAQKLAWGKCLNAGQTCVAPDYALCPRNLVDELAKGVADNIKRMYGETEEARRSCEYFVHTIRSEAVRHHKEIIDDALANGATAVIGATFEERDIEARYTPATVLTGIKPDMLIMQSEIFGPILPIVAYDTLDEAISFIQNRPKPLALYIFGKDDATINRIMSNTSSGSTCVNHCILQIENLSVPFGGVGMSGTGNYHGYYGFKTFSHERNVMEQGSFDTMRFFYPPYHQASDKSLRARLQRLAKKILG